MSQLAGRLLLPSTPVSTAASTHVDGDMVELQLPSGAVFPVHDQEVDYFTERVEQYTKQNHFGNITHLQDLDRVMVLELMVYRWGQWLSRQVDYWGDPVSEEELQKKIKEWSTELRQMKKALGLDKSTMDKQRGDDSVSAYLSNLLVRAREFGVLRERQLGKALELFNQMKALLTLNENCDAIERRDMHVEDSDVLDWLRGVAVPEYDELDAYFREHQQRTWIRQM